MEPKFVSEFTRSIDVEEEMYRYLFLSSPSNIVCWCILGVVAAANLVMMLIIGIAYANLAVLVMCIVLVFWMLYRYFTAVRISRKRLQELSGGNPIQLRAVLTDKELISESSDREQPTIVPFENLKAVFVTKHYYMIRTDARLIYAFRKGSFVVGREEEFLPAVKAVLERNKHK